VVDAQTAGAPATEVHTSDGDLRAELARVRRELDARQRTIDTLIKRVYAAQATSSFQLTAHNAELAKIVERKTAQVDAQRVQLEAALDQLQRTQAELVQEQKLTAIGQLAAGVAHEINTPAQYVSDNTTFLRSAMVRLLGALDAAFAVVRHARAGTIDVSAVDAAERALTRGRIDYLREQIPKAIEQSLDGIERISSIVGAMKSFSHPSEGVLSPTNLNEAITATITVARNEWKYVAEMVTELAPDLPEVMCLRDELNQVVLNLVVNAAHAIESRGAGLGTITVSTRADAEWVEIRVADTGCGIPEQHRSRVFEPFFTTKAVGKGTGQGLHIAYQVVVDKHRGAINFETQLGVGTTFIVRLPLTARDATP
jgi:two-component system NtrC family sensor kinase